MAFSMPAVDSKLLPKEMGPFRYLEAVADDPTGSSQPTYSGDIILNALAQHSALRLNVRRAMISIVTRSTQHVIAEATRTISLRSGETPDPDDALWMGCCILPTNSGLCQWTLSQVDASRRETSSGESDNARPCYVIRNMAEDSRFKGAPFVVGAPFVRFYAGVPIFSKSTGKAIGSYCVIDDKPGNNLDTAELGFMIDMADAAADHLELLRMKLERNRSEKMLRGVGSFIEGKASLRDSWSLNRGRLPRLEFDPSQESEIPLSPNENEDGSPSAVRTEFPASVDSGFGAQTVQDQSDGLSSSRRKADYGFFHQKTNADTSQSLPKGSGPTDVQRLFSRASSIIREAAELQGIIFLDATSASLRSTDPGIKKRDKNDTPTSGDESSRTDSEEATNICSVLGFSAFDNPSVGLTRTTFNEHPVDERLLRALLRRYPSGKIFNFDVLSSSSDSETGSVVSDDFEGQLKNTSRRNDAANLVKIFPNARSLAFFPLWDVQKGRWFAGAIAYTNQATRYLTYEDDLSYLASFGNNIMAEVSRMVALRADRAKADFISSISHELRSPLHGILGNAEFLKSTTVDALQADMVHSIETCGHTLLDTVNHLLDFAKINNFLRSTAKGEARRRGSRIAGAGDKSDPRAGMMMLESDLDLAILTEEALQTAFSGHDFQVNSYATDSDFDKLPNSPQNSPTDDKSSSKKRISVILDIQPANTYVFHAQGGALRRILMNACGNALKYTHSGFVRVKLQRRPLPSGNGIAKSEVTLIISDSGKGISKAYLRERLYTPFAQEDPYSSGTGLGLSILKQITTSLHGSIDVQSEQNVGTTVRVTLTLKHADVNRDTTEPRNMQPLQDHDEVLGVAKQTKGWRVAIFGFSAPIVSDTPQKTSDTWPQEIKAAELIEDSIKHLCQSWFGMHVDGTAESVKGHPNIYVTNLAGIEALRSQLAGSSEIPVVVLCPDSQSAAQATKTMESSLASRNSLCVAQPLGPVKLAKALSAILHTKASRKDAKPSTTDPAQNIHPSIDNKPAKEPQTISTTNSLITPLFPSRTDRTSPPPPSNLKLLLVDDNNINLQLLVTFCKRQHVAYATATNGLEALEAYKAAAGAFDCVLMDISMPVMDGMQATREIRQHERETRLKPTTVIALTGLASEGAQQEAFGSGIDLFLAKPVKLRELRDFLQTRKGSLAVFEAARADAVA